MKKFVFVLVILLIPLSFIFTYKKEIKQTRKGFNIYLQSGDTYVLSDSNEFPKVGYILNTDESSCENGGILSQNPETKQINVSITKSEKCNLYFDAESEITLNKLHSLNSNITLKTTTPDFSKISPLPTEYQDDGMGNTESHYTPPVNTNYITYGDDYTFNTSTGRYTLTNPQVCKWDECYSSLIGKYFTYRRLYNDELLHNKSNQQNLYQITSNSTSTKMVYKTALKTVITYSSNDKGLFKMEDDYGESLYFRGDITNNYVKYGKDKNNNDMYWRIVRINGDGTIRMIYDGTSAHENGEASSNRIVGNSGFNTGSGSPYDAGYVGFMYGYFTSPTGCICSSHDNTGDCIYSCTDGGSSSYAEAHTNTNSSTIKTYLEDWFLENIVNTGFDTNLSDEVFCNDKTVYTEDLGYGQSNSVFGSHIRIISNKTPSLKCPQKSAAFTKSDLTMGNGKLTYPVGLITADEMAIAGNVYADDYNYKSYLYKGVYYWSLSPSDVYRGQSHMYVFNYYIGTITTSTTTYGVAPVINLKTSYVNQFTGDGTKNNPFTVNSIP